MNWCACECCARGDRGSPMGGGEGMGLARRLALGSLAQLGADTTLAAPKDCRLLRCARDRDGL